MSSHMLIAFGVHNMIRWERVRVEVWGTGCFDVSVCGFLIYQIVRLPCIPATKKCCIMKNLAVVSLFDPFWTTAFRHRYACWIRAWRHWWDTAAPWCCGPAAVRWVRATGFQAAARQVIQCPVMFRGSFEEVWRSTKYVKKREGVIREVFFKYCFQNNNT